LILPTTLNQVGKTAKVFKQKDKLRLERLKLIMLMDLPIIKLRCFGDLLHQQNYTGADKIIAIMDAGFGRKYDTAFQRLRDNNRILGGYDFVLRNAEVYTSDSHGTNVLSTMGGYTEGKLVGTAQMLPITYLLQRTLEVRTQ
jgi:hypothetical protein